MHDGKLRSSQPVKLDERKDRTRAAEQRGREMTLATATELAILLADADAGADADTGADAEASAAPGLGQLNARERELVILVAQGRTDAEIAGQLHLSVRTVRSRVDRIRARAGCPRRADLIRLALQAGLV